MKTMMRRRLSAFTLIELLVVMAITAILLTLMAVPLIEGFRLTRTGQAFAEAQDKARAIMERIRRDLGTAAAVLDNSSPSAAIEIRLPLGVYVGPGGPPPTTTEIEAYFPPPPTDRYGYTYLFGGKIDLIPAAKGDPGDPYFNPGRNRNDPTIGGRDPVTGNLDPRFDKAPIGQINVPVAPGQTIVRYWIGLKDPTREYVNTWNPNMPGADQGDDNLFVLYRAEVKPYILAPGPGGDVYVPNDAFFPVDANGNIVINDPGFFEMLPSQVVDNLAAHQARVRNWKSVATILTHDIRTDFIIPEVDEATERVVYDVYPSVAGTYLPRIRSLIVFEPLRVSNEPAESNDVLRAGVEAIDPLVRVAPEYFKTEMIGWTKDSLVRFFHDNPQVGDPYFISRWRQPSGGSVLLENFNQEIVYFDPSVHVDEYNDGYVVFDLSGYQRAVEAGAALLGDYIIPGPPLGDDLHIFNVDPRRGRITMSFPADDAFGLQPGSTSDAANQNFTGWLGSATRAQYDPNGELARRFLDVRAFSSAGGNAFNPLGATARGYPIDAKIVPGSEIVTGPDQRPGANFGRPVRYSRVAASQVPGLNQYRINYTDIAEPTDYMATLGVPDPGSNADVRTYIQPRFKKGYIEFNSDPTLPLPAGFPITVEFEFQMNDPGDFVTIDYDSAERIMVEMTLRRFPGTSPSEAQAVTVQEVIAVRNFLR